MKGSMEGRGDGHRDAAMYQDSGCSMYIRMRMRIHMSHSGDVLADSISLIPYIL